VKYRVLIESSARSDIDAAYDWIKERAQRSHERYLRGILRALPSSLKSPWLFPSETGETPLDAKNFMSRVFTRAVRRAGLANFRWHGSTAHVR
jgi:plasmid stabilization system protein ParE